MSFLSAAAAIFGVVMGLSNLPQAVKIFRRKSAKDISIISYSLLFIGSAIWFFYGLEIMNWAIVAANGIGSISLFLVILGWFIYGRENNRKKHRAKKRL